MRPLWLLAPIALIVAGLWQFATRGVEVKTLRLAHALNVEHPVHRGMLVFADEVHRLSGGTLRVDIYADGKLGSERELVEQMQLGSIALTKVSAGQLEAFAPAYAVFGMPYLFDDSAHFWRFAETTAATGLLASSEAQRIVGLCFYDAGARSFYLSPKSGRTVRTASDLEGLSLRVMPSRTAMAMVEAFGAKPVPIPFGELYTALDAGTVDGAENNPPSLFTSRQFEVAASYSLNEHLILPDVLAIGAPTWQRLSAEQRDWIRRAAATSAIAQRQLWIDEEARNLEAMRNAGLRIIDDIDRDSFRAATEALRARMLAEQPRIRPLVEAIDAVRVGAP
jgi:tripartite ATP-independent transporter DctP family solute receptor